MEPGCHCSLWRWWLATAISKVYYFKQNCQLASGHPCAGLYRYLFHSLCYLRCSVIDLASLLYASFCVWPSLRSFWSTEHCMPPTHKTLVSFPSPPPIVPFQCLSWTGY
jgi:hypothetical protein